MNYRAALLALSLSSLVAPAWARPDPTPPAPAPTAAEPALWVVTADNLLLRSGDAYSFYPVGTLKAGAFLRADGERGRYARVFYPAGTRALVKAEEATADANLTRATLSRPSTLQAWNMNAGPRASWNPLLEGALPPGSELAILEVIKDSAGKVTHYAVQAPLQARAFVDRQGLRPATDDEAARFAQAAAPAPAPVPVPVTLPVPVAPAAVVAEAPTASPAPVPTLSMSERAGVVARLGLAVAEPVIKRAALTPPAAPVVLAAAPPVAPAPKAPTREEQLMALFLRLKATPIDALSRADLGEAISQFESYKQSAGGDAKGGASLSRIDGFIDVLGLMRDVKEAREEAAASGASWALRRAELARQVADLEKQRIYQVIGLLVPSAIYDGTSLPKLYRLQSPEPGTFRTVGYIAPAEALALEAKLGNVVGIVGSTQWDEALKAPMVSAQRVDVVSLAAIHGSPPSAGEILGGPAPVPQPPAAPALAPSDSPAVSLNSTIEVKPN